VLKRLDDGRAVARVDVDQLARQSLVPEREGDPLHVGRERDAVDPEHDCETIDHSTE